MNNVLQGTGDQLPSGSNLSGQAILGQVVPNSQNPAASMPNIPPPQPQVVTGSASSATPAYLSAASSSGLARPTQAPKAKFPAGTFDRAPNPTNRATGKSSGPAVERSAPSAAPSAAPIKAGKLRGKQAQPPGRYNFAERPI